MRTIPGSSRQRATRGAPAASCRAASRPLLPKSISFVHTALIALPFACESTPALAILRECILQGSKRPANQAAISVTVQQWSLALSADLVAIRATLQPRTSCRRHRRPAPASDGLRGTGRFRLNDGGWFGSQSGPKPFASNLYSRLPPWPSTLVSILTTCPPARAGLQ